MSGGRNSTRIQVLFRQPLIQYLRAARILFIVGAWQEYQGGADETKLGCNTPLDKYRVVGALQVGRYRKLKEQNSK